MHLHHSARNTMTFAGWRPPTGRREHLAMDALSMVIIAIGSLACLELAAHHLRGEERRRHSARSSRARR
jgi:hypothetical protein